MENRRNNIIRGLRAEKNQMINEYDTWRQPAFQKHINTIEAYPNPIRTMNNVERAYDDARFIITNKIRQGRPYGIVEDTVLHPTHHIKSVPMDGPMDGPMDASPYKPRQVQRQLPMQLPRQVERKVPKDIRRKSVKRVPKDQRRVSRRSPLQAPLQVQRVQQENPTGQKGQKDYKKDILIRLLELQSIEHGNGKDDRRKKAFQRHINAIMKFPYEIETIEDLRTIYRKAHLPTHGIAYKAIHTILPRKNITRRKQVAYQPSSFL